MNFQDVQVYHGAGLMYGITAGQVYRLINPSDADALHFYRVLEDRVEFCLSEDDEMATVRHIAPDWAGSRVMSEVSVKAIRTDIPSGFYRELIPHYRAGVPRDCEREVQNNDVIFRESALCGEVTVRFIEDVGYEYLFNRVGGNEITYVYTFNEDTEMHADRLLSAYRVRAYFEDTEMFSMNYGVEFDTYFASLTWWLNDMFEVGYARS